MPIYEYRCKHCNAQFDLLQSVNTDGKDVICPECNKNGQERLFSVFASSANNVETGSRVCHGRPGFT